MSEPLVVFDGVVKRFGLITAVRRMDLTIDKGEFVALMGPSGCGKTTTLRMLAGLEAPSEGEVRIAGRRMNDVAAHERDTPLVWQSLALFPFLNVRENVEFGLRMRGVEAAERRRRAVEWLERLGMEGFETRRIDQLSGGQRQRVALARSLVTEPEMLLLDEPLSALDAHLVIRMQGVLARLQRELGITFVYVTHSQSEAFAMADRVVIMGDGDIAQIGPPREVYRAPANRFVAEFVGRNNIFEGTITDTAGEYAIMEGPAGRLAVPASGAASGVAASIAVAADRLRVTQAEPEAVNRIACQLISEEFVGAAVMLYLEAPDGAEVKAQLGEVELEMLDLTPGASLWVSWEPGVAHLLPGETR
ncbi:MAG: ABC transporter ATP-binding protein [Alphaproteobacteria bacterium]